MALTADQEALSTVRTVALSSTTTYVTTSIAEEHMSIAEEHMSIPTLIDIIIAAEHMPMSIDILIVLSETES